MEGINVHYGQVVKEYGPPNETYLGSHKEGVLGNPDPTHISTSIIERLNLSVRQHVRRYARHTNAFSKCLHRHMIATDLHFFYHNFVRVHGSLKCTPAQAAGLLSYRLTEHDLIAMMEAVARPRRARKHRVRRWQTRPSGTPETDRNTLSALVAQAHGKLEAC